MCFAYPSTVCNLSASTESVFGGRSSGRHEFDARERPTVDCCCAPSRYICRQLLRRKSGLQQSSLKRTVLAKDRVTKFTRDSSMHVLVPTVHPWLKAHRSNNGTAQDMVPGKPKAAAAAQTAVGVCTAVRVQVPCYTLSVRYSRQRRSTGIAKRGSPILRTHRART